MCTAWIFLGTIYVPKEKTLVTSALCSEIHPMLRLFVACKLSIDEIVLFYIFYGFVANIAKVFIAFDTCQTILVAFFHIDSLTTRTQSAKLCVDKWTTRKAHILGNQLWIYFEWLEMWLVIFTLRVLFEVFLTFSRQQTCPAKPVVAYRTLHVRTTRFYFLNPCTAFIVWTGLAAMLEKKVH